MDIKKLRKKQILELCKSLLEDYVDDLTEVEKKNVQNSLDSISLNNDSFFRKISEELLPIVEKIWNKELESGKYIVISWNKYSNEKPKGLVTFATISEVDHIVSFCDLTEGIQYKITYDSIIGALNKDGATLIENLDKKNAYTIGIIGNKVINSYNGATRFITPKQLFQNQDHNYPSKHNELILDSRFIQKIGVYNHNFKKK